MKSKLLGYTVLQSKSCYLVTKQLLAQPDASILTKSDQTFIHDKLLLQKFQNLYWLCFELYEGIISSVFQLEIQDWFLIYFKMDYYYKD